MFKKGRIKKGKISPCRSGGLHPPSSRRVSHERNAVRGRLGLLPNQNLKGAGKEKIKVNSLTNFSSPPPEELANKDLLLRRFYGAELSGNYGITVFLAIDLW